MRIAILFAMIVLCAGIATAATCFTAVDVPSNNPYYWKAITYVGFKDGVYQPDDYLIRGSGVLSNPMVGSGQQYKIRVDKDCFNGFLLANKDENGILSQDMIIEKYATDYHSQTLSAEDTYTIAIEDSPERSYKTVASIPSGMVGDTDYLTIPASFQDQTKHAAYNTFRKGLCNKSLYITEQLDNLRGAIWGRLDYVQSDISCSDTTSVIDCALEKNQGNSAVYATMLTLMARQCGIPSRVVKGISEGDFNGIDIKFNEDKIHYWVEYYDFTGHWFNFEAAEAGSIPTGYEVNCLDGIDNDGDSSIDCRDSDCSFISYCSGEFPTSTLSSNINDLNQAYMIKDLHIWNEFGSLRWEDQNLDLRGINLDQGITIGNDSIKLHSVSPLDKPAIAVLKDINFTDPVIMRNNIICSKCSTVIYNAGEITFKIPGFGEYKIVENAPGLPEKEKEANVTLPDIPNPSPKISNWLEKLKDFKKWPDKIKNFSFKQKIIYGGILLVVIYFIWKRRRNSAPPVYNFKR